MAPTTRPISGTILYFCPLVAATIRPAAIAPVRTPNDGRASQSPDTDGDIWKITCR